MLSQFVKTVLVAEIWTVKNLFFIRFINLRVWSLDGYGLCVCVA